MAGITAHPARTMLYVLTPEFSTAQINGMMPQQFWDWIHKNR
jgi:hypothetical protein